MKRWHLERDRMLRRWRIEIALHEGSAGTIRGYSWTALAPVPPQDCEVWETITRGHLCHCYRGMGFLRKSRPLGCNRVRCAFCCYEKNVLPKARAAKLRAALSYEWEAGGGW
jgi:hypothetical protein